MKSCLVAGLVLWVLAGCSVNDRFVFKPGMPPVAGAKLPMKVAVLPFGDGTEDFTQRGGFLVDQKNLIFNLAKTGYSGFITALPPELWAKALAEDLAASGIFREVRFVYSPSELVDEEISIEGTVEKAYAFGAFYTPNRFALRLRASWRKDRKPFWEKGVERVWNTDEAAFTRCGISRQCIADESHAEVNRVMRELFAEAGSDLARTLASLPGGQTGGDERTPAATPAQSPVPGSVDETIEAILKGK
ncbi:MAG TPA: hypothetical protein VGK27_10290 [Candidatus Deferrimicrobiaceae bacterium]|jgi:hypothetical protein